MTASRKEEMEEKQELKKEELLALTAEIVSSHVANNSVAMGELPQLIEQVFGTLNSLSSADGAKEARPEPAVPIKKSITPNYMVCLEDGKKLKMLKRHLKTQYDMTPEQYRERWNLPADYPMVAPNYANQRRELAKKIGLGRSRKK
jgi:predicted transcriptional regulator